MTAIGKKFLIALFLSSRPYLFHTCHTCSMYCQMYIECHIIFVCMVYPITVQIVQCTTNAQYSTWNITSKNAILLT